MPKFWHLTVPIRRYIWPQLATRSLDIKNFLLLSLRLKKSTHSYLLYLLTSYTLAKRVEYMVDTFASASLKSARRVGCILGTPCSLVSCLRVRCTHQNHFSKPATAFTSFSASILEFYPDSVFWFGIGRYFPGIFPTNTKGKLGRDILVLYIWREPLFSLKGMLLPPFWWIKPPFWGKISSRQIYKKEFLQNFTKWSFRQILQYKKYWTEYTNRQVLVTYRYRPNCQ